MPLLRVASAVLAAIVLTASATAGAPKPRVDRFGDPLPAGAVFRIGTTRLRLCKYIRSIATSPDDRFVAAHDGEQVAIWEASTGRERWRTAAKTWGIPFFSSRRIPNRSSSLAKTRWPSVRSQPPRCREVPLGPNTWAGAVGGRQVADGRDA